MTSKEDIERKLESVKAYIKELEEALEKNPLISRTGKARIKAQISSYTKEADYLQSILDLYNMGYPPEKVDAYINKVRNEKKEKTRYVVRKGTNKYIRKEIRNARRNDRREEEREKKRKERSAEERQKRINEGGR